MSFDVNYLMDALKPFVFFKIGIVSLIFLFVIFQIIILNQVITMNKTLIQKQSSEGLKIFSYILLLLTISLFLIALAIL
ncbi:MAG TPA: DUF5657 family protein [Patescibacteria group bacterium]|nr:DUF5657 family protein [Patescibacteria group bacterium]